MRPAVLIGVLVLVGIAVAVGLRFGADRLDSVVAATVERYGSSLTGTRVDVNGVELALGAGRAEIAGLTVGNPDGYDTDYAVRIGSATVELDVGSLTGDVPVIEELVLDGALINAEQRGAATNLTDIQKNATSSPSEPGAGAPAAGEPGRIVVERYRVRNARVLVTSEYLDAPEELPLRDIVVENIGGESGATYSEAAEAMLLPILAAARTAATERLRGAAADAVTDAARDELDEESERLQEETEEARREVSEKLDELLERG